MSKKVNTRGQSNLTERNAVAATSFEPRRLPSPILPRGRPRLRVEFPEGGASANGTSRPLLFKADPGVATVVAAMSRNYNDELQFLEKINKNCWRIKKGFVPNMQVRRRSRTQ